MSVSSPTPFPQRLSRILGRKNLGIAAAALLAILSHLLLRHAFRAGPGLYDLPLFALLAAGGLPLVFGLLVQLRRGQYGSDLLAGISIVSSVLLGEYLAGSVVVLMLSGGEALEEYALDSASSVLKALAKRLPSRAHLRREGDTAEVELDRIAVGDVLVVYPHETCPVDGVVTEGHGAMDESYLTGEPYQISKTPGSPVMSGAINGESALTIEATRQAKDSRYEKILKVMEDSERRRPRLSRLGDTLGAFYTPFAVLIALGAWAYSGDPVRFLSVIVIATPCPLLLAIPVAIIGSVSLAARRRIIVKNATALERIDTCRTAVFDKTGTLTYGHPLLTEQHCAPGFDPPEVLALVAGLERYSRHPLADPILRTAREGGIPLREASQITERPGEGMRGRVSGRDIFVTSRRKLDVLPPGLPPTQSGLECVVMIDGRYAATYFFRDEPRPDSTSFIGHLTARHRLGRLLLLSGDRESEVRHLAARVGIGDLYFDASPEDKVRIVREETQRAPTLFVGDGINDAPAMVAATVGVAMGQNSDVTGEAADVVILDSSLTKVDEALHIGRRMRRIALQSAVGGIAISVLGMAFAFTGRLTPVQGAVAQEVIDVVAVLNALRAAFPPRTLSDA